MLVMRNLLALMLTWISKQGASTAGAIDYGAALTITPSRSGWIVAKGEVSDTQTIAPIIRITQDGTILSEGIGLTVKGTNLHTACYVRKGNTYTVSIFRATLINVTLY